MLLKQNITGELTAAADFSTTLNVDSPGMPSVYVAVFYYFRYIMSSHSNMWTGLTRYIMH